MDAVAGVFGYIIGKGKSFYDFGQIGFNLSNSQHWLSDR